MILKSIVIFLGCSLMCWKGVTASAYTVYVQSGPNKVPTEFLKYGPPSYPVTGSQIARLTAPGAAVPAVVAPCVSPCIVTPSLNTNSKYVAYNAPISSLPVIVPPNEEPQGYKYSYVVYDEKTGDQKAQRELSDGSVVRGRYSFIQPDGYIRDVQYTADDLTGFNAVVKNYLPPVETKNEHNNQEHKHEHINQEHNHEHINQEHEHEHINQEHEHEHINQEHEHEHINQEHDHEHKKEEVHVDENKHHPPASTPHTAATHHMSPNEVLEKLSEIAKNESHILDIATHYSGPGSPEDVILAKEDLKLAKAAEELISEQIHPTEDSDIKSSDHPPSSTVMLPPVLTTASSPPASPTSEALPNTGLVSYESILKCIQASINEANKNNNIKFASPLTYVILNKPCLI